MSERMAWRRTRQSNEDGGRQNRHVVKLTDEQELAAQAKARVAGVTVSRLLADAALSQPRAAISHEDLAGLFELSRLVAAVGRNLNQLTKVANATGELEPETAAALDAVRRMVDRLEATRSELVGR
ncbi:hypothetical protein CH278_13140 [Rhodococcus sp. 05-2254-5]|uniref:plasmid mobilization protein n=1 Tax=unclassified Rhodococcus (in: high G+C Gram-positive bacteria) TaxID=192944 RepID=UPI000B9C5C50|nr:MULTISPECIES: plasmid mobilization relaxosome protein MobC [unclassified Rhodococcus (in: high G+C Gram-positive bacteria)]OZE33558.1 hypothetical protein CH278_13140 [Rhodococcus sp. 05-2254-5]OZE51077.1 hypothetical protein CH269_26085 [Rhodococcus sp. 05-2254-1]